MPIKEWGVGPAVSVLFDNAPSLGNQPIFSVLKELLDQGKPFAFGFTTQWSPGLTRRSS
jgi:hypothetical protein